MYMQLTTGRKKDRLINDEPSSMISIILGNIMVMILLMRSSLGRNCSALWSEPKTVAIIQLGLIRRHLHTPRRLYY